jgi:3-deoxy-7-phosphoheptulonate synthase
MKFSTENLTPTGNIISNLNMVQENSFSNSKTKPVQVGNVTIGGAGFAVIAGPCSIESPAQFLETAQAVKNSGAVLLRGGIWKLRTSSKTFQGLGSEAFGFIKDVLRVTGLKLTSEVTDPRQIEVLDDVVEMYQVGSRNMHN